MANNILQIPVQRQTIEVELDSMSSSRPQKVDKYGRRIEPQAGETIHAMFYITENGHPKNLAHTKAVLSVKLPDGTNYRQERNVVVTNPSMGIVEAVFDKKLVSQSSTSQSQVMFGSSFEDSDYGVHFGCLELRGENSFGGGITITQHFMYIVFKSELPPEDTLDKITPSIVGQAVVGQTILGKTEINPDDRIYEMDFKDVEIQSVLGDKFKNKQIEIRRSKRSCLGSRLMKLKEELK